VRRRIVSNVRQGGFFGTHCRPIIQCAAEEVQKISERWFSLIAVRRWSTRNQKIIGFYILDSRRIQNKRVRPTSKPACILWLRYI